MRSFSAKLLDRYKSHECTYKSKVKQQRKQNTHVNVLNNRFIPECTYIISLNIRVSINGKDCAGVNGIKGVSVLFISIENEKKKTLWIDIYIFCTFSIY